MENCKKRDSVSRWKMLMQIFSGYGRPTIIVVNKFTHTSERKIESLYIGRRAVQLCLWALWGCIASVQQQLWLLAYDGHKLNLQTSGHLGGKGVKEPSSSQEAIGREDSYTPIPTGMALVKLNGSQWRKQDIKATGGPPGRRGRSNEYEQNMLYIYVKLSKNKIVKNKGSCS